jgi:TetR/AcrR family transcriptional regulator, transcriptional repressor for nem operon
VSRIDSFRRLVVAGVAASYDHRHVFASKIREGLVMNAKAEQKRRTHETILASAARLLRERGIAGARVADVMEGAGLTVGGFYAHFASKEALVDASISRIAMEMRARLGQGLAEIAPEDRAEVVLKRYLSAEHRDVTEPGCFLPAIAGEVATRAPEHAPVVSKEIAAMSKALEPLLAPLPGISSRQLAIALVALMFGGLTIARATRGSPFSDDVLKACRALGRWAARGGRVGTSIAG